MRTSDQRRQYTSLAFRKRCREAGVRPSMGSVGDAYDNVAMCESFFATLGCELLDRRSFQSHAEARMRPGTRFWRQPQPAVLRVSAQSMIASGRDMLYRISGFTSGSENSMRRISILVITL